MTDEVKRRIEIKVGGIKRSLKLPISVALSIEDEAGAGLLDLARRFLGAGGTLRQTAAVLRVCLAANGQVYTEDEMLDLIDRDGLAQSSVSATACVVAFLKTDSAASKKKTPPETNKAPTSP